MSALFTVLADFFNVNFKSLIVACGVRKVWSKELKDMEKPSAQISHLRKLLSDLGMKGRFSMEQAKAIKERRELAKELGASAFIPISCSILESSYRRGRAYLR